MVEQFLEIFMDDFSIYEDSFDQCLHHLELILQHCAEKNLTLNWENCHFMVRHGIVLGHKIFKNGIEVDRAKIKVIAKLLMPKCVKDIRFFLGHTGFYCFPLILQRGKLTKKRSWGAILQAIQKITSRSPQRFWRSVPIGVWSARDHFVPLTMRAMRFPSRLVRGIGEQKVGRTLLLLLKTASTWEFLLAWFRRFLERKILGYQHPD